MIELLKSCSFRSKKSTAGLASDLIAHFGETATVAALSDYSYSNNAKAKFSRVCLEEMLRPLCFDAI